MQDQIGAFLGGLDDFFEGRYNSLSVTGRQKIAEKWRPELIKIGEQMLRAKPSDIRAILENPFLQRIDGEDIGKVYRFAIEEAKIARHLNKSKPVAVIIKGNADRMDDRAKKLSVKFYDEIKTRLERKGYQVEFDEGLAYTMPRADADVWLGFSRGHSRIDIAKSQAEYAHIKMYKIESGNINVKYGGDLETQRNLSARDPLHFTLTQKDIDYINNLSNGSQNTLENYMTALALEQDASASGAQIIALTTRNKQLAEFSNVIPTTSKKRLNTYGLYKLREFRGSLTAIRQS